MLSLPLLKDDKVSSSLIINKEPFNNNFNHKTIYDYFNIKIPKQTIEFLYNSEKDERYLYFLRYGYLRRFEGKGDIIYVEIPQIPKNIVIYRKPSVRNKNVEKLYLNKKDLPHIPLLEGEENLKLFSLESNLITKIEHLISINNLLFLNLYENKIVEIENLNTVPRLKALMLGKNLINRIKNLNCLPDLEVLDLHSNKIKLIENLFMLKKLRILNLANNQLTSFLELINNKNLEDINLRKNLIVSIPNLSNNFIKLRKINLGKNMISKVEFILEFRKLQRLEDLYIEDNPVMFIKDAYKKLNNLPLKFKDSNLNQIYHNSLNRNNISQSGNIPNNINNNGIANNNNLNNTNTSINSIQDRSTVTSLSTKSTFNLQNMNNNINNNNNNNINSNNINNNNNNNNNNDNLNDNERTKLLNKIEDEWKIEYKYIIDNGFNGYNIKKLKETKMQLCHAEIERDKQLNLFGNALEVLSYSEYYKSVKIIQIQFLNFDLITQKKNIENLKKFINLKSLKFYDNNIHGFYQLIKLEDIKNIEQITIRNNEICNSELLKYFLVYRLQNIKFFNDIEITNKDIIMSKKIFENFDQAISYNENNEVKNEINYNNNKIENGMNKEKIEFESKLNDNIENNKIKFLNYVKKNLSIVLDEIIDM